MGVLVNICNGQRIGKRNMPDRSIEIYNSGDTEWSNTFNEDIKKRNINIAVASGFLYIGEFRVG